MEEDVVDECCFNFRMTEIPLTLEECVRSVVVYLVTLEALDLDSMDLSEKDFFDL